MPVLSSIEGDRLTKGDPIVVIELDKAAMDVETFHDDFLAAVLVPASKSMPVGSAITLLAESEDKIALAQSQDASFSPSASPSQETAAKEVSPPRDRA
jgi:pyruvate dehydrogenase E2 component (dihydrolipoamide acetyltransferase)